jgi:ABC-2 type transport system ATP-binding protein
MIDINDLVFDYRDKRALFGIGCTIRHGGITALVGPNGAGKTTLIRCVAGLARPLRGTVTFDGVDVHAHPRECHRRMGYLSDFFGVYDELTVRQCLIHAARAHDVARGEVTARVTTAAENLELADRMTEKAGELSRGLRQRLAIAQAIVHRPEFLMLDEPASGLDPEARNMLSRLLTGLRDDGMTILVSSHILAELEHYCTDMLILRDGRVVDHQALSAAEDAGVDLILDLAEPFATLAAVLRDFEGVSRVTVTDSSARLRFSGTEKSRHHLLRTLIEQGVPISGLREDQVSLQQTYFDRMGADGSNQPGSAA